MYDILHPMQSNFESANEKIITLLRYLSHLSISRFPYTPSLIFASDASVVLLSQNMALLAEMVQTHSQV